MVLVLTEGREQRGDAGGRRDIARDGDAPPVAVLPRKLLGGGPAGVLLARGDVDRGALGEETSVIIRPMPRLPPVTRATRPSSEKSAGISMMCPFSQVFTNRSFT